MTIIQAIEDEQLFRPLFKDLATWKSWLVLLRAIFALEMTDEERTIFKELSGRESPPEKQAEEAWIIAGRRAGKSFMIGLVGVYLACFRSYATYVSPGERVVVIIVSCDRRQSRVIFNYVLAALESVPMLKAMIVRQDSESIDLSNGVTIEIVTNSFRSLRGFTIGAAILDEVAYWRSEFSVNPDVEVLNAIRPATATVPNALIMAIGSPYRRTGVMHETHKRHYGKDGSSVLVIQATSQQLNPSIPDSVIARAKESDPVAAQAEWYATFRSDLAAFIDLDLIERCIEVGRRERAPLPPVSYNAFTDPSGGSHDSFTLAVGHEDGGRYVLDVCRGVKPPFDPSAVVKEFCDLLKTYRISSVTGDKYGGAWVSEQFQRHGIYYRHSDLTKSELYLEALPLFAQGCVDLLDYQPLLMELQQLERRTSRSGRDSVDHPPGGHDDHANAACGCLALLASRLSQTAYTIPIVECIGDDGEDEEERLRRREALRRGVPVESIR